MNIREAVKKCEDEIYLERAVTTAKTYIHGLNCFILYLESQNIRPEDGIEKVTIEQFIAYPTHLLKNKYSKSTAGVYLAAARFFMDWMVINHLLEVDYYSGLRYGKAIATMRKKKEFKFPRIPAKDAVDKIFTALAMMNYETPILERNRAILLFLQTTGCRNNEAAQLHISDCDMKDRSAIVTGKGDKQRRVYFSTEAARALEDYWQARHNREPSSPVFCRHDKATGRKICRLSTTSIREMVSDLCMVAGIDKGKFTPHSLRHAFAIRLLRSTGNLALVQDLMGHASPASTRVYATIYPDELRDAHRDEFH